ncbi:hypothetical protein ACWD4V_01225 [Streptomyces tsukubensis]
MPPAPAAFAELWGRLGELKHLAVTADPRTALRLDGYPMARVWAAKGWTAMASLDSYAAASTAGFTGGFYQFCLNPPPGAQPYPIKQIAMTESRTTMGQYGSERMFLLPDGERVEMQAHLKLGTRGIAPRVYFRDEVKGSTGRLVVGYIGPHLTNQMTH